MKIIKKVIKKFQYNRSVKNRIINENPFDDLPRKPDVKFIHHEFSNIKSRK